MARRGASSWRTWPSRKKSEVAYESVVVDHHGISSLVTTKSRAQTSARVTHTNFDTKAMTEHSRCHEPALLRGSSSRSSIRSVENPGSIQRLSVKKRFMDPGSLAFAKSRDDGIFGFHATKPHEPNEVWCGDPFSFWIATSHFMRFATMRSQ